MTEAPGYATKVGLHIKDALNMVIHDKDIQPSTSVNNLYIPCQDMMQKSMGI